MPCPPSVQVLTVQQRNSFRIFPAGPRETCRASFVLFPYAPAVVTGAECNVFELKVGREQTRPLAGDAQPTHRAHGPASEWQAPFLSARFRAVVTGVRIQPVPTRPCTYSRSRHTPRWVTDTATVTSHGCLGTLEALPPPPLHLAWGALFARTPEDGLLLNCCSKGSSLNVGPQTQVTHDSYGSGSNLIVNRRLFQHVNSPSVCAPVNLHFYTSPILAPPFVF